MGMMVYSNKCSFGKDKIHIAELNKKTNTKTKEGPAELALQGGRSFLNLLHKQLQILLYLSVSNTQRCDLSPLQMGKAHQLP